MLTVHFVIRILHILLDFYWSNLAQWQRVVNCFWPIWKQLAAAPLTQTYFYPAHLCETLKPSYGRGWRRSASKVELFCNKVKYQVINGQLKRQQGLFVVHRAADIVAKTQLPDWDELVFLGNSFPAQMHFGWESLLANKTKDNLVLRSNRFNNHLTVNAYDDVFE